MNDSSATQTKRAADWIGSTVTAGESYAAYARTASPLAMLAQRARRYVLICAGLNSGIASAVPLRLYRPVSARGRKSARCVGSKRLSWLRSGAGSKAVEYSQYADDVEEVTDARAIDALRRPNPWTDGGFFLEQVFLSMEIAGNAFVYMTEEKGAVELYSLLPQFVTIAPSETAFVGVYWYARDSTDPSGFKPEEIAHFKLRPSPFDPYYGLAPLQSAIVESDLSDAATRAEWARWVNGGRPDWVVKSPPMKGKEEDKAQRRAEIHRELRGVRNTGKPLVVSHDTVVEVPGFPPHEMEYVAGITISDEVVCNAFGVPASLVKLNDANLASSTMGHRQYGLMTIAPRCGRVASVLTERLLEFTGENQSGMFFAFDSPIPEDEQKESALVIAKVAAGTMTLNEARAEDGLTPYAPELGDVPRVNGVSVTRLDTPPVSTAPAFNFAAPPASPKTGQGESPDAAAVAKVNSVVADTSLNGAQITAVVALVSAVSGGQLPVGSAIAIATAAFPALTPEQIDAIFGPLDRFTPSVPEASAKSLHAPHAACCAELSTAVKWYQAGAAKWYGAHVKDRSPVAIAPISEAFGRAVREAIEGAARDALNAHGPIDDIALNRELERIIAESITRMQRAGTLAGLAKISDDPDQWPTVTNEAAVAFAAEYAPKLAVEISAEANASLMGAIRDGLQSGQTYDEVAERIGRELPEFAGYRADRIAATEMVNATTRGNIEAWSASGIPAKQWLLSGNPCEICEAVAADHPDPIPIGEPFYRVGDTVPGTDYVVTWQPMMGPGAHPFCACDLAPASLPEEAAEGGGE